MKYKKKWLRNEDFEISYNIKLLWDNTGKADDYARVENKSLATSAIKLLTRRRSISDTVRDVKIAHLGV